MSNDVNVLSNLDSILDGSLDDLKDLPSFKVPETGIYNLRVSLAMKEINKKAAFTSHWVVRSVVELADSSIPQENWAKEGDAFDVPFIMKKDDGSANETAEGFFKAFIAPFAAHFGTTNIRELYENHLKDGVDVTAKVEKKLRKGETDVYDARVSSIVVD